MVQFSVSLTIHTIPCTIRFHTRQTTSSPFSMTPSRSQMGENRVRNLVGGLDRLVSILNSWSRHSPSRLAELRHRATENAFKPGNKVQVHDLVHVVVIDRLPAKVGTAALAVLVELGTGHDLGFGRLRELRGPVFESGHAAKGVAISHNRELCLVAALGRRGYIPARAEERNERTERRCDEA